MRAAEVLPEPAGPEITRFADSTKRWRGRNKAALKDPDLLVVTGSLGSGRFRADSLTVTVQKIRCRWGFANWDY